jgi:hypothetical protein
MKELTRNHRPSMAGSAGRTDALKSISRPAGTDPAMVGLDWTGREEAARQGARQGRLQPPLNQGSLPAGLVRQDGREGRQAHLHIFAHLPPTSLPPWTS